jgi:TonB family protein
MSWKSLTLPLAAGVVMLSGAAYGATTSTEAPSFALWSQLVEQTIDRHLTYPFFFRSGDFRQGQVQVTFLCSDDGKPASVSVEKSSGSYQLDRAAMRAITRVTSLHPLPEGITHEQKYRAVLLFGDGGDASWAKRVASLRGMAADGNKWLNPNGPATASAISLVRTAR